MLCALVLTMLLLPGSTLAQAPQPVPALSARLIDQTGTLSADEARAIEDRLRGIEQKSGSQVVVLMVATTAPEDIAAYTWRVASDWKIGRRDVGDGLLVVIAKNDRRMRMEVARALEGAIPDLAAARIIDQQMAPRFRQGDYAGGITAALDQVAARIAGEQLPAPSSSPQSSKSPDRGFDMEDLMLFFFFGVAVVGPILRSVLGRPLASVLAGGGGRHCPPVGGGPPAGHEVLSNPASARISRVAGLSRRNARAKHRRFLVEGPQGVREAVRHVPGRVLDVYLTEAALERHSEIWDEAVAAGLYVHVTTQQVMDAMSPDAQGLLAVVATEEATGSEALAAALEGARLVAVLTMPS